MSRKTKKYLGLPFTENGIQISQVRSFVAEVLDYDENKGKKSFEELREFIYQNHAKDGDGTMANFVPALIYVDCMRRSLEKLRKKNKK